MLDAICILLVGGFFSVLVYSILTRPPRGPAPSPVQLLCSICGVRAGVVDGKEYARMTAAGEPPYCEECMATIQIYERRRGTSGREG